MKKIYLIFTAALTLFVSACQKTDFVEAYTDPSKISVTTVEKQFTGFLNANKWYVLPDYWNYFVVLRTTLNRYNQAVGWANSANQYIPGAAGVNDRWNNYYGFVAQYRELEKVYGKLSTTDQADRRIYMIAAAIYFYDHTQKVVDLHGDIPMTEAGKLSINGGDYDKSYPKYDTAEAIYTKMLDDLKAFSDELNSINVQSGILAGFKTQDFVNKGDLTLWKKYCNSLRLRILMRASAASAFSARATSEIADILNNPSKYPTIGSNTENIQIGVYDLNTDIHAKNFRSGLEDWDGNIAGKAMIDHMNKNADPRLRAMFEAGINAKGVYNGLDPLLDNATQTALIAGGTMAIYNRSTLSRNQFFPGMLMNAAEASFIAAEYYLKANNAAAAKTAYEKGVRQSIEFYYNLRKLSNDNTAPTLTAYTEEEVSKYLASADVSWDNATDKLNLIATQKWIHFSVVQPVDSWAEIRRLDLPKFNFQVDDANAQKQPPFRWNYPSSEQTYNATNYSSVKAKDNLSTKLFWDTK
ncbi:hypothetical protein Emtol_2560 [Emticicia oligotrophica DSM 17448]|uniref:SusD/RagB family nutrient-binding outer membrane lipoprotein n=1 Tax=Emticicia oligotrophica (strain DSM 17448 / CIP 109782 / MTCC 6937 / GPTSA100-15) TaxID=929562 RepID=A0ABN4AMZ5_EMTOG|nr:SusD/RagB family nutrient-binding outer membrane lipoprotein [Emticicia oligotrophica]AFK03696.1 hypothetical protein Emtol_2560 [Emticicia oligotrophica DSM 17448]